MEEKPAMERPKQPGRVDYSRMAPTFPEQPLSQALPVYPEIPLEEEISCRVELLVHVLTDGSVKIVEMVWLREPRAYREAFEASIRNVIATWSFEPARRFVSNKREDGTEAGRVVPVPKARRIVFSFKVVDGQGRVE